MHMRNNLNVCATSLDTYWHRILHNQTHVTIMAHNTVATVIGRERFTIIAIQSFHMISIDHAHQIKHT